MSDLKKLELQLNKASYDITQLQEKGATGELSADESTTLMALLERRGTLAEQVRVAKIAEAEKMRGAVRVDGNAGAIHNPAESTCAFADGADLIRAAYQQARHGVQDARLDGVRVGAVDRNMGESIGSEGGFFVPTMIVDRWLADPTVETPLFDSCDKIDMPSGSVNVPGFADASHATTAPYGITWHKVAENTTFGDTQNLPSVSLSIQAKKKAATIGISNELLEDAIPQLRSRIDAACAASLKWEIERCLWAGLGSGEPLGVLAAPGTLSVPKESSQAVDTITSGNITAMWSRLRPGSHARSIWACNHSCYPSLAALTVVSGTAGALVGLLQPGGVASATPQTLFGRPLYSSMEFLPPIGDAGDIVLLDPLLYMVGTKRVITFMVDPYSEAKYDRTLIHMSVRLDGQPVLSSVLTPLNGPTVAWAVTLAAR